MKKIKDASAVVGKYTDNDGKEKNRYLTIGALFERDDGSFTMKLEAVPVGTGFNGWVNFYDPKAKDGTVSTAPIKQPTVAAPKAGSLVDDEIPF